MPMNESQLQAGQVIFYDSGFWKVEHSNACRAWIVPMRGNNVVITDDEGYVKREFTAKGRGANIASTAFVELVDLNDAAALKALETPRTQPASPPAGKLAVAPTRPAPASPNPKPPAAPPAPPKPMPVAPAATEGAGWHMVTPAAYRTGSLAEVVMAFVSNHPGRKTSEIVTALSGVVEGNVASCLSRFNQAGLIAKR